MKDCGDQTCTGCYPGEQPGVDITRAALRKIAAATRPALTPLSCPCQAVLAVPWLEGEGYRLNLRWHYVHCSIAYEHEWHGGGGHTWR